MYFKDRPIGFSVAFSVLRCFFTSFCMSRTFFSCAVRCQNPSSSKDCAKSRASSSEYTGSDWRNRLRQFLRRNARRRRIARAPSWRGGKRNIKFDATHHDANDALAASTCSFPNNIGREAWGLVAEDARRDFGERDVENAGEVHWLAPRLAPPCKARRSCRGGICCGRIRDRGRVRRGLRTCRWRGR